jgi:hypothetical protein
VIPCIRRDPATGDVVGRPQIVVLEPNELLDAPAPEQLDASGQERVEAALGAIQARHPFLRWREWLLAAEQARIATRPEDAVIRLAVAVEVLLDSVLALALWEAGTPIEAGSEALGKDLARRVRQHFGPALGGSWDRFREPVASWSRDLSFCEGAYSTAVTGPVVQRSRGRSPRRTLFTVRWSDVSSTGARGSPVRRSC